MSCINMSIGEVIRDRRVELVIKQEDLAERMDVTVQTVSKWERDITEPKATQVVRLASILKLSERDICQGKRKSNSELEPFDFLKLVAPCMNDISETQVIMTMYDYVSEKEEFISSLAKLSERPFFSLIEKEKEQAQTLLNLYKNGAITFNDEEEKQKCLDAWNKILNQ